jgi:hypothetical protein
MVGCAVMVGSLWFLGNLFSAELLRLRRQRPAIAVQVILQATVLPYAAAYFAGSELKQVLQKFALAGLLVSLSIAAARLREAVLVRATRAAAWRSAVASHNAAAGRDSVPEEASSSGDGERSESRNLGRIVIRY